MCTSNITLRKFLKLYLWIVTYNVIFKIIFTLTGDTQITSKSFLLFTPFLNIHSDSFTSAFMVWWLFIPFLNVLINNLTRNSHLILLILTFVMFSIYPFMPFLQIQINPICWFSTLYIVASYIRKYPEAIPNESSASFWGWTSMLLVIMGLFSVYALLWKGVHIGSSVSPYFMISDSQQPLALFIAVSTFLWFKNLKIKNSKLINTIAASSFGVLLIHANSDTMRQWLWKDTVDCVGHYDAPYYWLYAIGCVLLIYIICTAIDYIRIKTIETPILNFAEKLCLWIKSKFSNS